MRSSPDLDTRTPRSGERRYFEVWVQGRLADSSPSTRARAKSVSDFPGRRRSLYLPRLGSGLTRPVSHLVCEIRSIDEDVDRQWLLTAVFREVGHTGLCEDLDVEERPTVVGAGGAAEEFDCRVGHDLG